MPTVAIIGGTGQTGKWALKGALQRGWQVQLLARSAKKADKLMEDLFPSAAERGEKLNNLTVVEGSVTDNDKLVTLMTGASVVMSFLGMVKPPEWIVTPGVTAVMTAMKAMGGQAPKFLSMSSISLSDSYPQSVKAWGRCTLCLVKGCMAKSCFQDLQAAEDYVLGNREGLNVTLCRATVLGDKKGYLKDYTVKEMSYQLKTAEDVEKVTYFVDRQHVAEAFLDLCESSDYDSKEVSVFDA